MRSVSAENRGPLRLREPVRLKGEGDSADGSFGAAVPWKVGLKQPHDRWRLSVAAFVAAAAAAFLVMLCFRASMGMYKGLSGRDHGAHQISASRRLAESSAGCGQDRAEAALQLAAKVKVLSEGLDLYGPGLIGALAAREHPDAPWTFVLAASVSGENSPREACYESYKQEEAERDALLGAARALELVLVEARVDVPTRIRIQEDINVTLSRLGWRRALMSAHGFLYGGSGKPEVLGERGRLELAEGIFEVASTIRRSHAHVARSLVSIAMSRSISEVDLCLRIRDAAESITRSMVHEASLQVRRAATAGLVAPVHAVFCLRHASSRGWLEAVRTVATTISNLSGRLADGSPLLNLVHEVVGLLTEELTLSGMRHSEVTGPVFVGAARSGIEGLLRTLRSWWWDGTDEPELDWGAVNKCWDLVSDLSSEVERNALHLEIPIDPVWMVEAVEVNAWLAESLQSLTRMGPGEAATHIGAIVEQIRVTRGVLRDMAQAGGHTIQPASSALAAEGGESRSGLPGTATPLPTDVPSSSSDHDPMHGDTYSM